MTTDRIISTTFADAPITRALWKQIVLLSLGGFFEFYDLFFTGYVAPGLVKSGILTPTTPGLFGMTGIAGFVAALFLGLFAGTALFGFLADRFGRRVIFTISLLWYSASCVAMALQNDAVDLDVWRFIAGLGLGLEMVTIDTYIAELTPPRSRGRAFALNFTIQFCAVPVVALLAWQLVPRAPLGLDGWRWVVLIGAAGALCAWFLRRGIPESPRWLAHRRDAAEDVTARGSFGEIWHGRYRTRTIMLILFHIFQTVGYYGFSNWVPTLLISQGINITTSLQYTFIIAIAAPFGPLLGSFLADRIERKWLIVASAAGVAVFGVLFGFATKGFALIALGALITLCNNIMSLAFHAYQSELYPTRIRARAVGFVYSWSRLSAVFSAFVIAFILNDFGVVPVFLFIAGCMAVVTLTVGILGPRTNNMALEAISE